MPHQNTPREKQLSDVLSDFARTMATDFPIQAILDHLIDRIVDMLPITAAGVTLIAPGEHPRYVAASDDSARLYEELQTDLAEGPCVLAYTSGEAVTVPDLHDEQRFPNFTPRALAEGMRAVFTFPLRHGVRQLGALDLYRETAGPLSDGSMTTAQTLADVAAAYLINAQAREDLADSAVRSLELALHDGLTGLPNRTLLLERIEHAFQRSRRSKKMSAVIFIDLDNFKSVNDTYGHSVGDQLLVGIAKRLAGLLRAPDTIARLHGDEFVILCEDLANPNQATSIVTRIAAALGEPFYLPTAEVDITASVGIAFVDNNERDAESILHDADNAMYQAKRNGRGRHQVFDPRQQRKTENRESLERDLHHALSRGELHTVYQPIVNTQDRKLFGFEALVRWDHPTRGPVLPLAFIPLAEQSSLISDIGQWVLQLACTDQRRWQRLSPQRAIDISVNVSTQQLMAAGFTDIVAGVLHAQATSPQQVTLEVTESVFIHDSARALLVLNDLKELGVKIALDDFGTGYSSLSYLNQFPVDIVKIDRTFVANLGKDSVSDIIANAVVQLAHTLGMKVVAEGIETEAQHHHVTALGCDASQGFYYARPMSATDAAALIDTDDGNPRLPAPRQGDAEVMVQ